MTVVPRQKSLRAYPASRKVAECGGLPSPRMGNPASEAGSHFSAFEVNYLLQLMSNIVKSIHIPF